MTSVSEGVIVGLENKPYALVAKTSNNETRIIVGLTNELHKSIRSNWSEFKGKRIEFKHMAGHSFPIFLRFINEDKMNYETYQVKVWPDGREEWYLNDQLHRENGPAITYAIGSEKWFYEGKCHRVGGPALILADGTKKWYCHGKPHREDGPAIEHNTGQKEYYLHGKLLSSYKEWKARMKSHQGKVIEIEGRKYKLQEI